jgi:hypothetical protein
LAVTRAVAQASLLRVAPATPGPIAIAESAYLARLVTPCGFGAIDGADVFQAHPERALVDEWEDAATDVRFARGASLFWWWLDDMFSTEPASTVRGVWALSPTHTPPGAIHWRDEPDVFDVLAVTFKGALGTGSTLDGLWLRFAVARAFFGANAVGEGTLLESRTLGALGKVQTDWTIPWPDHARRLASVVPMAATGAAYLSVDLTGAPQGARLRLAMQWEERATIRWAVVKVGAEGKPIAQYDVTQVPRGTTAQLTLEDLAGGAKLIIVGANVGDPRVRVDPDDAPWEPHGWLVTLEPLEAP